MSTRTTATLEGDNLVITTEWLNQTWPDSVETVGAYGGFFTIDPNEAGKARPVDSISSTAIPCDFSALALLPVSPTGASLSRLSNSTHHPRDSTRSAP